METTKQPARHGKRYKTDVKCYNLALPIDVHEWARQEGIRLDRSIAWVLLDVIKRAARESPR